MADENIRELDNGQERNYEVRGITDKVTNYSIVGTSYPNLKLHVGDKMPQLYKLQILKTMLIKADDKAMNKDETTLTVYIVTQKGEAQLCGKIYQTQVKALIKLFEDCTKITIDMNENNTLTGQYVYCMCV